MLSPSPFEDLLPYTCDSAKAQFRSKLIYILNSQGEILPAAQSPLGTLWRLLNSPDSSINDCQKVIELDPALAARIFRVANSAAYGGKAANITDAIFNTGFKSVRELVFSAGVFNQLSSMKVPVGWELFWMRNIFVARLTERLAASYFPTDGSEYLAGLIHDMGWLFLVTYFPDEFDQIVNSGMSLNEAEKEILPFNHADIGGAICARSLLPPQVVNSIVHHHDPMSSSMENLITPGKSARFLGVVLSVCDKIADSCQMDLSGPSKLTLEEIQESPEVQWLNHFGHNYDFETFIEQELPKSEDVFTVFFLE